MYSALYPSIIEQSNMAPNTMHGKVIFDEQLDPRENRFNNDYFERQIWFMEDLLSGNVLDFCHRYMQLPTYEEMYDLIWKYFTTIINASRAIKYFDPVSGNRYMTRQVINSQKRMMTRAIDNTVKRNMIIIQERMPKYDNSNSK